MEMPVKRRKNTLTSAATQVVAPISATTPSKPQIGFPKLLQSFVFECRAKNLAYRTIEFYKQNMITMQKTFEEQNQDFDVLTMTNRDIKHHYIGYMLCKGLASNTVNGRIKTCKAFFKLLYEEGYIKHKMADELRLIKTEKKMIQTFTKRAVACPSQPTQSPQTFTGLRDYTIMMVLLETGMRIGELLNLKIGDLFLKEMEIRNCSRQRRESAARPHSKNVHKSVKTILGRTR